MKEEENEINQVQAQGLFFTTKKEEVNSEWFWKNGLSIDESKISTLIICLLICMAFAGYNYVAKGDITNNLTSVITALIYAIAGVNVTSSLLNSSVFNKTGQSNPINPNNQAPIILVNNPSTTGLIPPGVTSVQKDPNIGEK